MAHLAGSRPGRARQLCPVNSDVDFLRDLNGVVYLDTKVTDSAFDFSMAEEELDGSKIARPPIDQRRLGPT
jgi:hypothetical protein